MPHCHCFGVVTRVVPTANDVLEAVAEHIRSLIPCVDMEKPSGTTCADIKNGRFDTLPSLNTQLAYINRYLIPLGPGLLQIHWLKKC
jgi:hypothetical protein